uniref:Uncharacterized protein n=1 Tax=Anguilla anguilla TaxID=7936 RepID=A0A0E9PEF0_ANGAN
MPESTGFQLLWARVLPLD